MGRPSDSAPVPGADLPLTLGLDVRSRAEITAKVAEATRFITGDTTVFDDPDLAGAPLGRLLDARPPMLLLLDDVWNAEQLAPFLIGGAKCRRLITTRLPELLPGGAFRVKVDEMSAAQARQVLGFGLPGGLPEDTALGLLRATGRWPLLLRICNQYVHRRIDTGLAADDAAAEILGQLRQEGPAGLDPGVAVDLNHPRSRQTAVAAAVEAGAALLPPGGFERFTELGVFAEDEFIPVRVQPRREHGQSCGRQLVTDPPGEGLQGRGLFGTHSFEHLVNLANWA